MKKIKFISAIALTMVLASCENFDLPNPPGQTNPDPDGYFENSGLVLSQGDATINLKDANANNQDVTVANVAELINFPSDYTLSIDMQVAGDANFTNPVTVSTTLVDNAIEINPDVFNGAIQSSITKQPGTYDVYTRYIAYAELGTTRMRLGGLDAFYGNPFMFTVTTLDPTKVIEDSYYLVPMASDGTPDWSDALKMNNTSGNVSPYDNPEFAIKTSVSEAQANGEGLLWKIAPASAYEAKDASQLLGCNPSEASDLSGKLGVGYNSGSIKMLGDVLVTINAELDSYTVNYAFEVLYPFTTGNTSNPSSVLMLTTNNYINYDGVAMLNTVWYLAAQPDYKGAVVFKQDTEAGFTDSEDGMTREGGLTGSSDGGRLETPVRGKHLYYLNINLVQLTYAITCLNNLGVVGSNNGWDPVTRPVLTPNSAFTIWTASDIEFTKGDEFKINANEGWDISFSGTKITDTDNEQVYQVKKQDGGDNLMFNGESGKYDVTVDFSAVPYTVTLKKK